MAEKNTFAVRDTKYQNSLMVNICDIEIIGKEIIHQKGTINISKVYWQERTIDDKEARILLSKCNIANLVGKNIVNKAIEMKFAKPVSVKYFSEVPFLMIFKFNQSY